MAKGFKGAILIFFAFGSTFIMANEDPSLKAVAQANTEFTSSFYNALTNAIEGNLIFSPYSLSAVMAMLKIGAGGKTATDIQKAMKFPTSDNTLNQGYSALINSLKSDDGNFTLETANKIYAQKGFGLKSEFSSTLQKYYGAELKQLDFSKSAESAKEINDFVSKTTHEKIKDLISAGDLDAMTRLVLVNAIYFKGFWKNKFNPQATRESDFHTSLNSSVKVQMMRLETDLPYAEIEELNAKAVALPYKGDRLSMIILLPNEIDGLKDMETRLKTFPLASIPSRLRERKINLSLPKFTLESTIDLKGPLSALGAGSIFDQSQADFSGISKDPNDKLYVSKAVQKAFIEVNEEGSEAAAATGIQVSLKSAFIGPRFLVNRPFLAMITEDSSSSVLFFTTFSNPEQTETVLKSSFWTSDKTESKSGLAVMLLPSLITMPLITLLMGSWVFQ